MSIVCAIKDKITGNVWMACDSQSTQGQRRSMIKDSKIIQKGPLLFGCVGNPILAQIISTHLELPEWPEGMEAKAYITKILFPVLHKLIQESDTRVSSSVESEDIYCMLVACHGHIFNVGDALIIDEYDADFDAVGAGEEFAIGAFEGMTAVSNITDYAQAAAIATAAAIKHNITCGGQIKIYQTEVPISRKKKGKEK